MDEWGQPTRARRRRAGLGVASAAALLPLFVLPAAAEPAVAGPSDPALGEGLQWGLQQIGAPDAWSRGRGDGVVIAIVDSGIDGAHEDLRGKVTSAVTCLDTEGQASRCAGDGRDDNGHGTHVAGIAAAHTGNGVGIAGVAPDASLMAVRVLRDRCDASGCVAAGQAADVIAGVRWAADHGAAVINLSLGTTTATSLGPAFGAALEHAWARGAVPVVAAGNDVAVDPGFADYPALVVTATQRDGAEASYAGSVGQARWPIAAPGGEAGDDDRSCGTGGRPFGILATHPAEGGPGAYACLWGTSMAAAHVAGAVAVLRSMGVPPQATVNRLLATAQDLGAPGRDDRSGAGALDVARAVDGLPPPVEPPVVEGQSATERSSPPGVATDERIHAPPDGTGDAGPVLHTEAVVANLDAGGDDHEVPPLLAVAAGALASGVAGLAWRAHRR